MVELGPADAKEKQRVMIDVLLAAIATKKGGRLPTSPATRRAAHIDDTRAPALRKRLPLHPEFAATASLERLVGIGEPPGSLISTLRTNTQRLFPSLV